MEKRNLEQRWAIKFCVKLNENATETYEKLRRAYGEHAVLRTQVFRWHKAFLDGRESVEDEPRCGRTCTSKKRTKMWTKWGISWGLIDVWQSEWSVVFNLNRQTVHDSEKGFIVSGQRLRTLECCISTMLPVTLPSPWTKFWPKKVFQWFRSHHTRLIWVRVTSSFSQNSNCTSRSSFWNCAQHPKDRDRPAEGTSTWRLPALLPGVGATSPAVSGFPRELLWRG